MRIAIAFTLASLMLFGCGEGVESDATPSTPQQEGEAAQALATCEYVVRWSTAGVWEKPTISSTLLKHKYNGDIVVAAVSCGWTVPNDGFTFVAVETSSAEDGIGWMKADALRPR